MLDGNEFLNYATANPVNAALLQRLPALSLPQCHLVAGCLFQAVWNFRMGQPPETAVKDYDVFYFDIDSSYAAEDAVIQRVNREFADLGVNIEVKNQARVHLWYRNRFGADYPALHSARDGIDRYLIPCTCVGIEVATNDLYAPNGLNDLWNGVLRINPLNAQPERFREKASSYAQRWPWLTIVEPD